MNKLQQTMSKHLTLLLCLITIGVFGQKESKTYKETYIVANDALLEINTSHTDLEFETWDSDQILIEARIELEGATLEEADAYFKNSGFSILGNSKKVSISTQNTNSWEFHNVINDVQNFQIEIPEMPSFDFDFDFEELIEMPMIPINPMTAFDHEAFEKDGEKYLKEWQKAYVKGNDKKHQKRLEEWAKKMEERQELLTKKRVKSIEKRAKSNAERVEKMANARAKRMEANQKRLEHLSERQASRMSRKLIIINGDTIRTNNTEPNVFYSYSSQGNKNYKVKKTIKIKMPKDMRIKMNVRHGEVKLAENTNNLNATLSHSTLWATTIDGDKTTIKASYTPINVENWNLGALQADYSERVDLKKVTNLRLNSNSSEVIIDDLMVSAFIKNEFGPIYINSISNDFKELNVSLLNAELKCTMPTIPFTFFVNGTSSELSCSNNIALRKKINGKNLVYTGYHINDKANSSIVINSEHSNIIIE